MLLFLVLLRIGSVHTVENLTAVKMVSQKLIRTVILIGRKGRTFGLGLGGEGLRDDDGDGGPDLGHAFEGVSEL